MIGYVIIIIIIGIIVSIITEQMLIRRLKLEEGVTISKGRCVLKEGYGLLPTTSSTNSSTNSPTASANQLPTSRDLNEIGRNNLTDQNLNRFFKPLK